MKLLILSTCILALFISCEKIPVRSPIQVAIIAINGDSTKTGENLEIKNGDSCRIDFMFKSDAPLDSIYIKFSHTNKGRISGADTVRIENMPKIGSEKGIFTYTINTIEQYNPTLPMDLFSKYVFLKVVLINKNGTVRDYKNQITII